MLQLKKVGSIIIYAKYVKLRINFVHCEESLLSKKTSRSSEKPRVFLHKLYNQLHSAGSHLHAYLFDFIGWSSFLGIIYSIYVPWAEEKDDNGRK